MAYITVLGKLLAIGFLGQCVINKCFCHVTGMCGVKSGHDADCVQLQRIAALHCNSYLLTQKHLRKVFCKRVLMMYL